MVVDLHADVVGAVSAEERPVWCARPSVMPVFA
jgi:hypothetical protein